jgi:hypothetical protein
MSATEHLQEEATSFSDCTAYIAIYGKELFERMYKYAAYI